MFIIGIDPHRGPTQRRDRPHRDGPGGARAAGGSTSAATTADWSSDFTPRVWAIEGAAGTGALLAQQLVAAGER